MPKLSLAKNAVNWNGDEYIFVFDKIKKYGGKSTRVFTIWNSRHGGDQRIGTAHREEHNTRSII